MCGFSEAIARKPGASFPAGLTAADLGVPDLEKALLQHAAYCDALRGCGLKVTVLEQDDRFPDSTFVEDTAVITRHSAIIARPGHATRLGEEEEISGILGLFLNIDSIEFPGTLDGGDVLQIEDDFLIGLSERTNREGARQLSSILESYGYTSSTFDVGRMLHLKSGISYLGNGKVLAAPGPAAREELRQYEIVPVTEGEEYCANSVMVNGKLLFPAGHERTRDVLIRAGFHIVELDVSEFRKMDGGISCLSLRIPA
jgi:dimethylargininase